MASAFASQLQAIAKNSSHELDLKARRNAHAESLLFERDVAVKQDFGTIYNICNEGFRELCQLDQRFHDFDRNLFSDQAKDQDREQMTRSDNEALDLVLKHCLTLLGGKILLKPALKALEWLVRRFRVHVYNVDHLLHTLLPYHELPVWANVLSIVPNDKVLGQWKFVRPYLKTTWHVPRHAVAFAASNNDAFFTSMNSYTLDSCRQGLSNSTLIKFWSGIVVEAVSNRIVQTRSGRKEVQAQRVDDLLHKVLSLLSEAYDITGSTDLITTCYTISIMLAAKVEPGDNVLDSLLLAVAQSLQKVDHDASAAIITMNVLTMHKTIATVPKKVLDVLASLEAFASVVRSLTPHYSCQPFLLSLTASAMSHIRRKNAHKLAVFSELVIELVRELYPDSTLSEVVRPVVTKAITLNADTEANRETRARLIASLQKMNENPALSVAISEAAAYEQHDPATLEGLIGMTITLPEPPTETHGTDVEMTDVPAIARASDNALDALPSSWEGQPSCLAINSSKTFTQLAAAFDACALDPEKREAFSSLPIWSSVSAQELLWHSFLLRFACTKFSTQARSRALRLLAQSIQIKPSCYVQYFVPYALALLSDAKAVRGGAADLLNVVQARLSNSSQARSASDQNDLYNAAGLRYIADLQHQQVASLIADVVTPVLEECMLDPTYATKAIRSALQPQSKQESRKGHSQALFLLLTQHALATPLVRIKVIILSMLSDVEKVGGKSKRKVLQPMLQEWTQLTETEAIKLAEEGGMDAGEVDASVIGLADLRDKHYLAQLAESTVSADSKRRGGLTDALFNYVRKDFRMWTVEEQFSAAEVLFDSAFSVDESLAVGAQDVLRSVDLPSEVLANILQTSQAGTSDVKVPPAKRRKRSSSGTSFSRTDAVKALGDATAKIGLALELIEDNSPELKPELVGAMFEMLATLRQLQQNRVNSPYHLNLCLGSIHAMIGAGNPRGKTIDLTGVKPELVTECLRNADNPQVQNASLLVLASLSTIVPDRMVHNVMPIFTFIGHNMLSKDDDHSVNVINEAIDKIVPALLENLRKGKNQQSYQTSMASMLASFTSAYDHIPRHRRVAFYQKLLFCVKANEYGYMLVALLAHQQRSENSFGTFIQELVGILSASTQLQIYRQLLYIAVDVLTASSKLASVIFNTERSTTVAEKSQYAQSVLFAATTTLKSSNLASVVGRLSKGDTAEANVVRSDMQSALESTLTTIRNTRATSTEVSALAKQGLDHILRLPTLADLIEIVLPRLDEMDDAELRPQAIRVLAVQIERKHTKTSRSQDLAFQLLKKLEQYVTSSNVSALQFSSMACLDRIVDKYGRKSPETVMEVAHTITGVLDPTSSTEKWLTAALLTLAGMFEAIKGGAVPVVPELMARLLHVLAVNYKREDFSAQLWTATCALLSAIFSHAAFVISEEELAQVLEHVFASQSRSVNDDTSTDLEQLIRIIARKVDLEVLIVSSKRVLIGLDDSELTEIDTIGELEFRRSREDKYATTAALLTLLSTALEGAPKSAIIKQAASVSELFLAILDREASNLNTDSTSSEDSEAENQIMKGLKEASIKFVYKVNDTTFRPIFELWVDWAESNPRRIVLFDLLAHFFDTLKAIVTSYASYLLKPISSILKDSTAGDKTSKQPLLLLLNTLTLFRTITSHDQDSFFAAPSHFDSIAQPLISSLTLAASKSTRPIITSHIIPTILSLATSTMDSPSTHTTLTHHLVQLKSAPSAHVRGASIRALIALTEDKELGDEFTSNVIGIGAGEGEGARGGGGSVGEIMVYVNEMLEDDDESVEHDVRRWVQMVRAKVGEDVFEV